MPAIEDYHSDEFDDDTDLPLPSAPSPPPRAPPAAAPAAGANAVNPMAGLQAMMEAMGAGGMMNDPRFAEGAGGGKREKGVEYVEDDGPYKDWHPIYPIYLDAKRAFGTSGGRRIPREKAHWWPLVGDLVKGLKALRLPVFVEAHKTHPKDWENPGRVKTEYLKDGVPINPSITNRKQLYLAVAEQMHRAETACPSARPANRTVKKKTSTPPISSTNPKTSSTKGKYSPSSSSSKKKGEKVKRTPHPAPTRLPSPPRPIPAPEKRLPENSPALAGGQFLRILEGEWQRAEEAKKSQPAVTGGKEGGGREIESATAGGEEKAGKEKKEKKPKVKMVRGGKR